MSQTRPIRTLAVIGAGNMGSGIAQKMATEGFPVILLDLDDAKVARGLDIIATTLAQGVERKIFRPEQAEAIRARIRGTADWSAVAEADLVVEAVFEDLTVKREVFERLERHARPEAILGTNTSSFAVTDLAKGMKHPERILGLHYFYHPAKNRLVEVIPGEATSPEAVRRAWALQEQIGKTPIRSADASGFIVNRYFVPWLNEAVRLLEEGVADIPTIEAACKKAFGVGMGPFELMNVTGVPIAKHAANTLGQAFGPMYAPAKALVAQVDSGKHWNLDGTPDASKFEAVNRRMLAVVFLVATQ
ncbi:MAG TPA: 3-hydroxyacyl-CoA dehydrogenase family protein, partial [Candidatus Polarisedimenticolaceae bacterium]